MRKKILFYLVATALLVVTFISFNNAYKELLRYAELTNRTNLVYSAFQNLSKEINNAAISNPALTRITQSSKAIDLFFTDSASVIRQLDLLRSKVRDSVNIRITDKLNTEIREELMWLLKSDVPDSIIDNVAPNHIASLEYITSLIEEGIARTNFLIDDRKRKLNEAFNKVVGWMIVFIILSLLLLLYTTINLFRQRSKTQAKEKELEIKEEQFRNTLDNMLEGVQMHDFDWRYIYVNDALVSYSKYTREELLGATVMEKYPGIEQTDLFKAMQRCMSERVTERIETEFIFPDGTKAFFELSIQPIPEGIFILSVDKTKQKAAEEEHEFNKNNLDALINNTNDLMWSVDKKYELITSNQPFEEVMRQASGKIIKKGDNVLLEAISPEQAARFKTFYNRAFAGESFIEIEYSERPVEHWIEISFCPIRKGNEVIGTACHSRDITLIKESELQLLKSESFNRGVLSSLSSHIAVVDNRGNIVAVNDSWTRFAKENGDVVLQRTGPGTNYFDVCEKSAKEGAVEAADALQGIKDVMNEKKEVFYLEYPCHSPDKQRWFGMRVMKFHSDEPMVVIAHQDITERKLAEQNKLQSEERLKEAQALANLGNWVLNFSTGEIVWSEEACRIYGLTPAENKQTYESCLAFVHPEDLDHVLAVNKEAEKTLSDTALNYRIILRNGTVKHIYSLSKFEFDKNGKPIGLYGITHDITTLKVAEEEREKMVSDIIQRSKNLEQFAYIISHNLRGPVANILGISNMLKSEMAEEDRKQAQLFLYSAVENLDDIIKDLVKILQTRSEITENKETVYLQELIDVIESSILNLIQKEEVKIITDFSEIDKINTLKSYFHSIFYNLISNSIKYKQPDKAPVIKIKSCVHKSKVRIVFEDNGTGIDLDQHGEKIFGLYKRFHPNIEGKGLGLFMVKTQVEVLGGSISIKSKADEGTEFIIELPL